MSGLPTLATLATFAIEVVGGPDHGARLAIDSSVRTVGRARDADLVLRDPSVSRRHVQVVASGTGVAFVACGDASPFVASGALARELDAKEGDKIVVGSTTLVVVRAARVAAFPYDSVSSRTDVATLLTGVAEDARAIAAVHALIELLDAAADREALDCALQGWAATHARAAAVAFASFEPGEGAANVEVVTRAVGADHVAVSVPAPADAPIRLTFECAIAESRASDSFRRMLVVAGRIFGSAVARVHHLRVSEAEVASLRAVSFGTARGFLGESAAAQRVADLIPRLAASNVAVLIEGETGTGKTFVARLIHEAGPRASEPLRVVNCASIPENLAEAELFGHERGAFTGAVSARAGAFESAERGTLLLDEVGELSLNVQSKLLRVLEERRFERVGSNRPIDVQARILCATNRDLGGMIARKEFRSDLFFRISSVRLSVPPLRERGDDLVLLAQHILADVALTSGRRVTGFSPAAIDVIRRYAWPGNVRELRNALEHAVVLGNGELVVPEDLPIGHGVRARQPEDGDLVRLPLDLATVERRAIEAALRHTNGNRTKAAALLGVNRQTLYNKLGEAGGK